MKKPPVRYVICPGTTVSRTDGNRHFISAGELMRLYGVNPAECVICPSVFDDSLAADVTRTLVHRNHKSAVWLAPRSDGNYSLPAPPAHADAHAAREGGTTP